MGLHEVRNPERFRVLGFRVVKVEGFGSLGVKGLGF